MNMPNRPLLFHLFLFSLILVLNLFVCSKSFAQEMPKLITYKIKHAELSYRSRVIPKILIECMQEAKVEIDMIYDRLSFEITPNNQCLFERGQPEVEPYRVVLPVTSTSNPITGGINIYAENDPLSTNTRLAIALFDPLGSEDNPEYPDAPVTIYFFEEYPNEENPVASMSTFRAENISP